MSKEILVKISNHPAIKILSEVVDKKTIARLIVEELQYYYDYYQDEVRRVTDLETYEQAKKDIEMTKQYGNLSQKQYEDLVAKLEAKKKDIKTGAKTEPQEQPPEETPAKDTESNFKNMVTRIDQIEHDEEFEKDIEYFQMAIKIGLNTYKLTKEQAGTLNSKLESKKIRNALEINFQIMQDLIEKSKQPEYAEKALADLKERYNIVEKYYEENKGDLFRPDRVALQDEIPEYKQTIEKLSSGKKSKEKSEPTEPKEKSEPTEPKEKSESGDILSNVEDEILEATEEQISTALVIQTVDEEVENVIPSFAEYSGRAQNQARAKVISKLLQLPAIQQKLPEPVTQELKDIASGETTPQPDKEKKVSGEFEPLEVSEENKKKFIEAVDNLRDEFYKKRYKVEQGTLVNDVIDAIAAIAGEEELELSYQQASDEEQVGDEEPIEEQEENNDLDIEEKEMRDLRASFRSFLNLVNKAKKALEDFEKQAEKGTIMSSGLKKAFMKLLVRLQKSISLLVRAITNVVGEKQELQEATKEEILKQWKTVQKTYKNTLSLASALKELLKGKEEVKIDPETTLQDAYSSAIELSQYFPSVNPFGRTTGRKSDLKRYREQFSAAITDVKDNLQYVVNVIKRGASNKPALSDSIDALKEFSGQIKDIFGVEGPVSGKYNPEKEEATKEEPQSPSDKDAELDEPTPVEDDKSEISPEDAEKIKKEFLDNVANRQQMIRDSIGALKMTSQPDEVDALTLFIDNLIIELTDEEDTIVENISQIVNLIRDPKISKAVVRVFKELDSRYKEPIIKVIGKDVEDFVQNIMSIVSAVMMGAAVEAATEITGEEQKDNATSTIPVVIDDFSDKVPKVAAKTIRKLDPIVDFDVLDTSKELDILDDPSISYEPESAKVFMADPERRKKYIERKTKEIFPDQENFATVASQVLTNLVDEIRKAQKATNEGVIGDIFDKDADEETKANYNYKNEFTKALQQVKNYKLMLDELDKDRKKLKKFVRLLNVIIDYERKKVKAK